MKHQSLFYSPSNFDTPFALVDVKFKVHERFLFSLCLPSLPSHLNDILLGLFNSILNVLVSLRIGNGVPNTNGMT